MFIDSAKRGWLHHISELLTCQVKQRLPAKELLHKGVLLMLGYFQETTAYQCDCGLVCGMMRAHAQICGPTLLKCHPCMNMQ